MILIKKDYIKRYDYILEIKHKLCNKILYYDNKILKE